MRQLGAAERRYLRSKRTIDYCARRHFCSSPKHSKNAQFGRLRRNPTGTAARTFFSILPFGKELDESAIDLLWNERTLDEWPAVDAQRDSADFVNHSLVINS